MNLRQVCVELLGLKVVLGCLLIPVWFYPLCSDKILQPKFHGQVQVARIRIDV